MNWKESRAAVRVMFFLLITLFAVSCSSTDLRSVLKGKRYIDELKDTSHIDKGWIDNDTFVVTAEGYPVSSLYNKVARRESSERIAVSRARAQVLEKFSDFKFTGEYQELKKSGELGGTEKSGIELKLELEEIVKEGVITEITYDAEDNCIIVYEVSHPGLKKMVARAEWK